MLIGPFHSSQFMCPKCFLKTAGKPNNYQFYLPNFIKFFDNISHKLLRNNQAPLPYSVLQYIGRVATPKLVPRNCFRYLQTTLIIGGGGIGFTTYVSYCR